MSKQEVCAMIAAAGMGRRMNYELNKQFLPIRGKPMIRRTLEKFDVMEEIDKIVLLIREGEEPMIASILHAMQPIHPIHIVIGGKERQDSIWQGLQFLSDWDGIVLTHDGARPFITRAEILESIRCAEEYGACCLMTPMKDTVKISSDGKWARVTPDRSKLYAIQTPQGFQKDVLVHAYRQAFDEGYYGTDDCSLVEKTGKSVRLIPGSYNNIKITTPEDLILAEAICEDRDEL
ncbi:2-C-methyl-D-erythritol 4-phosphate cytidylyltransferase 2 [Aedoeadaptatus ivorii]|uniref:2-C-methyl-D-erythritol 4-phosphate cytidylyltransferase n=1 Tax=Aedoeadaptatus ivorii TaxID=54006 RepID=A0A3S4YVE1_9FIRM|nr:2-C-methyl-D-erythritol 4-phosphate cytidylyltransferase [Peptoniphilus ivorii]MDQ0507848.1 2-C-methyl-D-erythritol 4-phosphate cytidylyltransferase [Peptoniphilus ivorii]VEJ35675.1 2-C-methyl-D-erythritol 4-phosphate cytidylyltransferase 2 [Peptoniphilus ivorii]